MGRQARLMSALNDSVPSQLNKTSIVTSLAFFFIFHSNFNPLE